MVSLGQGKRLVKVAREAIKCSLSGKELRVDEGLKREFSEVLGVFVTLNKDHELRGCIGFPEGVYPLYEGVITAAKSVAFSDPRFMPLEKEELKDVAIEVSVLTRPELIKVNKAEEYVNEVKVGRDGLIVRSSYGSGLLLPQVAVEYKWDSKTFLEHTCIKAGLSRDMWKSGDCKIYRFQSNVFSEVKPEGEVRQVM